MRHGAQTCLARPLAAAATPAAASDGCTTVWMQAGPSRVVAEMRRTDVTALLPAPAPEVAPPQSRPHAAAPVRLRAGMALATAAGLALLWAALTGGAAEGWVFGLPAVLVGAAVAWRLAPPAVWRISPTGALRFAGWFAVQAVRGALDVALRAFHPRMPVAPGYRRYPLRLPPGAPRLVMANAITLLPGTLTAELEDDHLIVHLLDVRADATAELLQLEARVRALFALPALTVFAETRP